MVLLTKFLLDTNQPKQATLFLLVVLSFPGCAISFDDYQLGTTSSTAGSSSSESGQGGQSGTAGAGGQPSAGSAGNQTTAGTSGNSGSQGQAGSAGSSMAGNSGTSGTSGTSGASGSAGQGGGGAGAGGNNMGGSAGATLQCPTGKGPIMLVATTPNTTSYCIDRTEVTNQQYSVFLASSPNLGAQPAYCSWNTTFVPEQTNGECVGSYDPDMSPNNPVRCIDWCDAKMYCEWAGKRLCGEVKGTGPLAAVDYDNPNRSQWYNACSLQGMNVFPYGNTYQGTACNGLDSINVSVIPVTQATLCVGGYSGLHDMSGNVAEWEDSCASSNGAQDMCNLRGGSYLDFDAKPHSLQCNSVDSQSPAKVYRVPRSAAAADRGFRCCSDG
jgi:formylglycine-generating enzyme